MAAFNLGSDCSPPKHQPGSNRQRSSEPGLETKTLTIVEWLERLDLAGYAKLFVENEIDFDILPELGEQDLKELDIPLGHRKRLLKAIRELETADAVGLDAEAPPDAGPGPAEASVGPERRQLTVMFCDLVNSTALSTRLDPEDMRDVILQFQTCCEEATRAYGGYVAAHMGDGMLIYFGYPKADEHDPERAIRAGLSVAERVAKLGLPSGLQLSSRVGIATGMVVVGDTVGSAGSQKHEVVGETPNLAARLQSIAGENKVAVSDETRRLVPGLFELVDLGRQEAKGFTDGVQAWQVLSETPVEDRFSARQDASAGLTELTGRQEELATLKRRWQSSIDGQGQAVLISGEAGIGKSRLTRALRDQVDEAAIRFRSCYCSPYHTNSALFPLIDLLQRQSGITPQLSPKERLAHLSVFLEKAGQNVEAKLPLLASLLEIPAEGHFEAPDLSPHQLKDSILDTLIDMVRTSSSMAPMLFVFEDLHWIDPTTEEFFDRLIDEIQTQRVMVVGSYRPEYSPTWSDIPHVTTIPLTRLAADVSAETIAKVAGKPVAHTIVVQIVEKSDGIPLYIEELTRTLIEGGHLIDRGDIYESDGPLPSGVVPNSLQDSLMSRLDRLSSVKEVALLGSVIGRRFTYAMLQSIADMSEVELQISLRQLVDAQILSQRGTFPDANFLFKHSLVQDAAYASLLRTRRQILHQRIAEVLVSEFQEIAREQPEVVAFHFERAGQIGEALALLKTASEKCLQKSASAEAVNHLTHARELISQLTDQTQQLEEESTVLLMLGAAHTTTKGWATPEAEEVYLAAKRLSEANPEGPDNFPTYLALHRFHALRGELSEADQVGRRLLSSADSSGDVDRKMPAHVAHGYNSFFMGFLKRADEHLATGIELYDPKSHEYWLSRWGEDPGIVALGFQSLVQCLLNREDDARDLNKRGLQIARDCGHHFSIGFSLWISTRLFHFLDQTHQVREVAEELLDLSRKRDLLAWMGHAMIMRGWAMCMTDNPVDGLDSIKAGLAADLGAGALLHRTHYLVLLADCHREMGDLEAALQAIDDAESLVAKTSERYAEPEILRMKGELLELSGAGIDDIATCFRKAEYSAQDLEIPRWTTRLQVSREQSREQCNAKVD